MCFNKLPQLFILLFIANCLMLLSCSSTDLSINNNQENSSTNEVIETSGELLRAIKNKDSLKINSLRLKLTEINEDSLDKYLMSDIQKKAFWINIYNAFIQLQLSEEPERYQNRSRFFSKKSIAIAGKLLSFDGIEHGIIRSSKLKFTLGYFKNPFPNSFEKKIRTTQTDYRIHFALNCGAKDCPPIAIYDAPSFNEQIDEVSKNYLKKTSHYDSESNTLKLIPLFSWFRGDFGGKSGSKKIIKTYHLIPQDVDPTIQYTNYDWSLDLGNYYEKN